MVVRGSATVGTIAEVLFDIGVAVGCACAVGEMMDAPTGRSLVVWFVEAAAKLQIE